MMRVLKTNRLVHSPAYPKIITMYNEMLTRDGKVNNKKFYEQVVLPELPGYRMESWYQFLKRFKTEAGIVAVTPRVPEPIVNPSPSAVMASDALAKTMLSNKDATAAAISKALNIGAQRLQEIMDNPQLMSAKDAIDLVFKAMKAQDSRIHAIGKVKEDNREEIKMERAFANGAYE